MTPIVQRRFAMAAAIGPVFSILLASLGTSIANVALPEMTAGLSALFATVQCVVIGYLLSLTVLSAAAGWLGDRIGHGRALRLGMVAFTVGAGAAAVAPQVGWLIAARMVPGARAAAMIVLPMALLRETAGSERLGRTMGLLGTASAIGIALGPTVGGVLIAGMGSRAVFWLLAALGVLALAMVQRPVAAAARRDRWPVGAVAQSWPDFGGRQDGCAVCLGCGADGRDGSGGGADHPGDKCAFCGCGKGADLQGGADAARGLRNRRCAA